MSTAKPASRPNSGPRPLGLPTLGGPAVVAMGLTLGTLIVVITGSFTFAFSVLFAIGTVVGTLFVNIRGLFVTVTSIPVLFAIFTLISGARVSAGSSLADNAQFSATTWLTGAYPIIERFPSLLVVTLLGAFIATLRLSLAAKTTTVRQPTTRQPPAAPSRTGAPARSTPASRRSTAVPRTTPRPGRRSMDSAPRGEVLTVAELAARNRSASKDRDSLRPARSEAQVAQEKAAQERIARARRSSEARQRERAVRSDGSSRINDLRVESSRVKGHRVEGPQIEDLRVEGPRLEGERVGGKHYRPDPARRAGQPVPEVIRRAGEPTSKVPPRRRRHRLDDDLYGND
ncbi:DUF6542 domain-containing protein [Corynebacterium phocae]|uniref:DUF6542 domain-containing protein n=1 Tax=Corynebacterium phocae TaxID=161895 RepID=UPI00123AE84C|nr:DUF6542 domain-containing protein [Corynebacterium phocae]KAA8723158.1 hypothetical protein F4V58_07525 [Corynebacterium phocae]